jgi:hypothetical protein
MAAYRSIKPDFQLFSKVFFLINLQFLIKFLILKPSLFLFVGSVLQKKMHLLKCSNAQ